MDVKDDTLSQDDPPRPRSNAAAMHLMLELECARPTAGPASYRLRGLGLVRLGRGARRTAEVEESGVLSVAVPDGWMSSRHAELRQRGAGWEATDLDSRNGMLHNGMVVRTALLADGDSLQLGRTFFRFRAGLPADGPALLDAGDLPPGPGGLRTLSHSFAALLSRVAAVAPARVGVLIRGESGTGKEVLARALHALSGRGGDFVAVNCGALPEKLVEAELFGHKRGAFSGADRDRLGLVRASAGGTLFLDEIGDLPLPAQAALLRMLQESEVLPVGASKPVRLDLRVVAATHRDLDSLIEQGSFRPDLLARLDGVTFDLPPLRERREDVPLLIALLLRKLAPARPDVKLAPEAAEALLHYSWPMNVRELEQALAGALALSGAGTIELNHLPRALVPKIAQETSAAPRPLGEEDQRRKEELIALLQEHRGNLASIARAMGKGRTQVARWVARYGLDAGPFRND